LEGSKCRGSLKGLLNFANERLLYNQRFWAREFESCQIVQDDVKVCLGLSYWGKRLYLSSWRMDWAPVMLPKQAALMRCKDIHMHYAWRPAVDFYSGIGIGWLEAEEKGEGEEIGHSLPISIGPSQGLRPQKTKSRAFNELESVSPPGGGKMVPAQMAPLSKWLSEVSSRF
jgi:hypothetical protein